MYSVFLLLLLVLGRQTDGLALGDAECDYIFPQSDQQNTNSYNVVEYDSSVSNYCTAEDVPNYVSFYVKRHNNNTPITSMYTSFMFPKKDCGYRVALLVNSSVKDKEECDNYEFVSDADGINSEVHTAEKNVCVRRNANELMKYNGTSTTHQHNDSIVLVFSHISTGCYALLFHLGGQKYVTKGHIFIKTPYQRLEITEPQFICKYNTYTVTDQRHEITNFLLDISLLADIGEMLKVGFIPVSPNKPCVWQGEWFRSTWIISLLNENLKDNCSLKEERMPNGEYIKTVKCNFQVQTTESTGYCFIFYVIDDRCENTSGKSDALPCAWIKRCVNSSESSPDIDNARVITSSFLTLPIAAVVLVTIVGALYFFHVRIRKAEVNLYVNPQHDDFLNPACLKPTDFGIVNIGGEKGIDNHDDLACDDIVLLYTKDSPAFMTLMKDFRETLAKTCSCAVRDWHDGAEWNDVAKVGAVTWFTELFNSGCRVVWIDTPASRSAVTPNTGEGYTNANKLSKYYVIGDFRDVAFPVVLDLAKRSTRNAAHQYRRHFVVRFKELECAASASDPFLDLSPHARYCMPQHLAQLCSDLSVAKPISKYQMKTEEDLLQQRLESLI